MFLSFSLFFSGCNEKQKEIYSSEKEGKPNFREWSKTPTLGWNTYDAYHGAVTEKQFLQSVDSLEKKLLPYG